IFKQGVKFLFELIKKVVPEVEKHPYFKYHKTHLEQLGKALTASDTFNHAMRELNTAIASADAAAVLTTQLTMFDSRKNIFRMKYASVISGELELARDTTPEAETQLKDSGQTRELLRASADDDLVNWRGDICELYFDAVALRSMTDVEYRAAKAAFDLYNQK